MGIRKIVPYPVYKKIWGDRKKFGLQPDVQDFDWEVWLEKGFTDFYQNTQQSGIGDMVSRMAYPVIGRIDFGKKQILEVGPGIIRHLQHIKNKPVKYAICDINEDVLNISEKQLRTSQIPCDTILLTRESSSELPFEDESFDIVVCFNSLEHHAPHDNYRIENKRIF